MIKSVRMSLTLWYVAVCGLLLAGFSALVYGVLYQNLYTRLDKSLTDTAGVVAGEFQSEIEENGGAVPASASQTLNELQLRGMYVAILDDNRYVLASNFEDNKLDSLTSSINGIEINEPGISSIPGSSKYDLRFAITSTRIGNQVYLIAVAEPLTGVVEQLRAIRRVFYLGFPGSLLIAGIGGFALAKKGLAPVVEMANQADRISAHNLHERLTIGRQNDELGQLARVFNALLSRLDGSFESMRAFVADASHELRTPLAIIRGEADVSLSEDREPGEYRDALAIIQDEAKRISRIVEDLMALARADAGQRQLRVREFYLNDLIEECCKATTVLTLRKGVALNMVPMQDISFNGDEDLIRRMLMNLMDNAIKYTPAGGSVSVRAEFKPETIEIVVADTGIGIGAVHAERVFDRFYRVDGARSRADGGTGLGLAIAKWVAEAHRGSISLISQPGKGSTFTVSLPR